jgi:hypothetical protein
MEALSLAPDKTLLGPYVTLIKVLLQEATR